MPTLLCGDDAIGQLGDGSSKSADQLGEHDCRAQGGGQAAVAHRPVDLDAVVVSLPKKGRTIGIANRWWYDPDAPCQGSSLEDFGFVSLSVNFSDLRELSLLSGVTEVRGEIQPPTPQTSLTRPSGAATAGLVSGQRAANAPAAHKSDQWAQDGDGVKVGIIDGGYQGFTALMGNQVPSAANVQSWYWDSMMVAAVHDAKRSHVKHARRSFGAI